MQVQLQSYITIVSQLHLRVPPFIIRTGTYSTNPFLMNIHEALDGAPGNRQICAPS